jgi:beta-N-acetylglucosaminidase
MELFELDKSRLAEGIEYVANRYVAYFGISGFRYTVTVYFEAQEALKMIGLA